MTENTHGTPETAVASETPTPVPETLLHQLTNTLSEHATYIFEPVTGDPHGAWTAVCSCGHSAAATGYLTSELAQASHQAEMVIETALTGEVQWAVQRPHRTGLLQPLTEEEARTLLERDVATAILSKHSTDWLPTK